MAVLSQIEFLSLPRDLFLCPRLGGGSSSFYTKTRHDTGVFPACREPVGGGVISFPGDSWQSAETFGGDVIGEMGFLVSGGGRPEMLLIALQCIGRPTSESYPCKMSGVLRLRGCDLA